VLDMAITQYSFGKLYQYKAAGQQLPLPGGYDNDGNLTTDPSAIIESQRPLPVGFWKGSGLALVLDLLATVLSKGDSTEKITERKKESGVSQVFICIKPDGDVQTANLIEQILDYTKTSRAEAGKQIQYPGEGTLRTRKQNLQGGIPVDEKIWQQVLAM
jgi:3-dehydro-L-gulonate 2-dehydrogenase